MCRVFLRAFVLGLWCPALLFAQTQTGVIKGVVTDPTNQPVPGATITITSKALITGSATTASGPTGAYQFIALPPGVYNVTFELEGFRTILKESITVSIGVVSNVDGRLDLATLAESVTVTGGAPTVDVQSNAVGTVFDKNVITTVPTGKSPWALAELVPGVQTGGFDVGGSQAMQNPTIEVHGSATSQRMFAIDGVNVSWTQSPSGTMIYYDQNMFEEVSYQTNALSAEAEVGGVYMNMVTKSGGDEFHGQNSVAVESQSLQGDNFTDKLRQLGAQSGNPLKAYYDVNSNVGGRLIRSKLWFFGAYRQWRVDNYVSGVLKSDGTQAVDDNRIINGMGKLTYQVNKNHKISYVYNSDWKDRYHRRDFSTMGGGSLQFIEDKATRHQKQPGYNTSAQWDWVVSSQAFASARFGITHLNYASDYQPEVGPNDISHEDLARQALSVAGATASLNLPTRYQGNFSFSYFKDNLLGGFNDIKVGIQPSHNVSENREQANGDLRQQYFNGVPLQVAAYNTPLRQISAFNVVGVFAQDAYTRKNLTLNLGLRYDYLEGYNPDQTSPAGRFVPARHIADMRNMPLWSTISPRVGFSYALGSERNSSVKAYYGRYYFVIGANLPAAVNPLTLSYDRRSWTDVNGDDIAQDRELGPSTGFIGGTNQRFAQDLRRPYSDEFTLSFNRELRRVGVSVAYYRRENRDQLGVANTAVLPTDYTPMTVTNPVTGTPLTVYNQNRETVGRISRVVSNSSQANFTYNGVEFAVTRRMANRWQLSSGLTIGRNRGATVGDITSTDDLNNPNRNINRNGIIGNDATYVGKVSGIYQLPWSLNFSGSFRYSTGYPLRRILVVRGVNQVSDSVDVVPRGTFRADNVAIVDLSLTRSVKLAFGKLDLTMDVFNVGNSNAVFGQVENIGPSLGRPSKFLPPRVLRLGIGYNF